MTQIRQRQVKVQVTSDDPSGKVFRGIYADSSYKTLLTTSKTYDFKLNAGQTEELYIRYSQAPITITFKSLLNVPYQVTGSFGTVEVDGTDVVKTVEFSTDTISSLTIGFTSVESLNSDYLIKSAIINGSTKSMPYSMTDVKPGTKITFNIEVDETTTTTSTTTSTTSSTPLPTTTTTTSTYAPATLEFKQVPVLPYYEVMCNGSLIDVEGTTTKIINTNPTGSAIVSIDYIVPGGSLGNISAININNEYKPLPCTFKVEDGDWLMIVPVLDSSASTTTTSTTTSTTTTTTTTTVAPAVLKLQSNVGGTVIEVTSDGINPEEVSLAGTSQSSITIDMKNAPLVDA